MIRYNGNLYENINRRLARKEWKILYKNQCNISMREFFGPKAAKPTRNESASIYIKYNGDLYSRERKKNTI